MALPALMVTAVASPRVPCQDGWQNVPPTPSLTHPQTHPPTRTRSQNSRRCGPSHQLYLHTSSLLPSSRSSSSSSLSSSWSSSLSKKRYPGQTGRQSQFYPWHMTTMECLSLRLAECLQMLTSVENTSDSASHWRTTAKGRVSPPLLNVDHHPDPGPYFVQ